MQVLESSRDSYTKLKHGAQSLNTHVILMYTKVREAALGSTCGPAPEPALQLFRTRRNLKFAFFEIL